MDGREFYRRIAEDERFEWLGSKEGKTPAEDQALVGVRASQSKFSIAVSAIGDHSWDELEDVLTGKRSPRIMTHITRIVGYYSQLHNWNRSKIAELRDRHKGDYTLEESEKEEGDGCVKKKPEEAIEASCGARHSSDRYQPA